MVVMLRVSLSSSLRRLASAKNRYCKVSGFQNSLRFESLGWPCCVEGDRLVWARSRVWIAVQKQRGVRAEVSYTGSGENGVDEKRGAKPRTARNHVV
jgi:hypothetical protein